MTRRHFEMLAQTLRQVRSNYASHWDPNLFRACDDHAKAIGDALAQDNPRFDRERFLRAAGVQS